MSRVLLLLTVFVSAIGLVTALLVPQPAVAASGSDFDPGDIITDGIFFNSSLMSEAEVQNFLASNERGCVVGAAIPCLRDYHQDIPARSDSAGYCSDVNASSNSSAAHIIYVVAQACGINPQVILVTLQKERGLVTATQPIQADYNVAMGYACPDSAACDTTYYGFFNQVYSAARQFLKYGNPANNFRYQAGRTVAIQYSPTASCGSGLVYIQNRATAALYNYTPYQPNAAALQNVYGPGNSCSAYGNRNFFVYFTDWFGPAGNLLSAASFEGTMRGWSGPDGYINQAIYQDPSVADDGSWFLATNTPVAGRSISQDVLRGSAQGQQYTATIQVRSGSGSDVTGVLALWALGGASTEMRSTAFTAKPDAWTTVTVRLPVQQPHTSIRLSIYQTMANANLWVDGTSMYVTKGPIERNLLSSPSFEGGFGPWGLTNGFMNRAVYDDSTTAEDGSWFAATNTPAAGHSLSQNVTVAPAVNSRYDFSIWVRSSDPQHPVAGTVALWGLGGSTVLSSTPFVAGPGWTQVAVSLETGSSQSTIIRPEIYVSTVGTTLFLDNATLARNLVPGGSFESGATNNWVRDDPAGNLVAYSQAMTGVTPPTGSWFGATNATRKGASIYQDLSTIPMVGDRYHAEVWVRAQDLSGQVAGTFAVWAEGGSTEVQSVPFTAGSQWQLVSLDLPVTQDDHSGFRVQVYLDSPGSTLFIDGVQLY